MLLSHFLGSEISLEEILARMTAIARQIHNSCELSNLLNITVGEIREILDCDRVVIYRFLPDGDGVVAEESVNPQWQAIQGQLIYDPCFNAKWVDLYRQGKISFIEDIDNKPLTNCYKKLLNRLQVRANLVVPILVKNQKSKDINQEMNNFSTSLPHLWGLLIAHHCDSPHQWHPLEIKLLQMVTAQLAMVIETAEMHRHPEAIEQSLNPQNQQTTPNFTSPAGCESGNSSKDPPPENPPAKPASISELNLLDRLQTPIWIFDINNCKMWWANQAALYIWDADTREELLNRNFSDISESTRTRLQKYLHEFQQGKTIAENWTFYPQGKPISLRCMCSGIEIEDGILAMLVEGTRETINQIDQETLRSIEAMRHTSLMISVYTMEGMPLMQNPAAFRCYGDTTHPNPSSENAFISHFVDPHIGQQAIATIQLGEVFSIETQVFTTQGIRWHGMDIRCTRDPVTGNSMLLVNEKDITQRQIALLQRKRVEEELRWKETLLRCMTDASLLGFYVVDNRTDKILYSNHRFWEIWGIEHLKSQGQPGEIKNNDIIAYAVRLIADGVAFAESFYRTLSQENTSIFENEILLIDGRTIRRFSSQIRNSNNKYFGDLYIFEDISERKHLEKFLRLTDFSFECLAASAIWIDKNANILRVNQATCRLLGYDRDELKSLLFYEIDINLSCQNWEDKWQLLTENKSICFISAYQKKDGSLLPVEITFNYVEFNGEEYNFVFSRDISEHLKAETALRESEERYRSVIAAMAEGIVLQHADGKITACNDSAERILGLTAQQMMGLTSLDKEWKSIHEDGSPFAGENHPASVTLRTGKPLFNVVMGVHKPDNSLTWISINSQPLFKQEETKPYAVVTSFTDITVRKQAEQALQQQAETERMIYAIAQRIRQSLQLDEILNTTVCEVRHFLQTERVIIYRFNPDWSGVVVKESVAQEWSAILNRSITDTYFVERQGKSYQQNTIKATADIYTAGFDPCHVQLLEDLQVRAKLVVPILKTVSVGSDTPSSMASVPENRLWGLLVAHHCSAPREWHPLEMKLLEQLATQVSIAIQQSELHQQLQIANQQLENLALVDQLTQISNRRCFDEKLNQEWNRLLREQHPLSLLLCDIDYFKQYNDNFGHATGDMCLKFVAQALKRAVHRSADLVARYGGEEFAVVLPNTDSNGALEVAQRIQDALAVLNLPHIASAVANRVTLSVGIATVIPTTTMAPINLIEAADRGLYQAKQNGRNCCFTTPM